MSSTPPPFTKTYRSRINGDTIGIGLLGLVCGVVIGFLIGLSVGRTTRSAEPNTLEEMLSSPTTPSRDLVGTEDFTYGRVTFNDDSTVHGEVTNNSGRDFSATAFSILIYSRDGTLSHALPVFILNFRDGEKKTFTTLNSIGFPNGGKYATQFDHGS